MRNNERVDELIHDYTVKSVETLITMLTKERELIEYQNYLIDICGIYDDARMYNEVISLSRYIGYINKCII